MSEVAEVELPAAESVELPSALPPLIPGTPNEVALPSFEEKNPAPATSSKHKMKKRAPLAMGTSKKKEKEVRERLRQARQAWFHKVPTALWICVAVFVMGLWFGMFYKYY